MYGLREPFPRRARQDLGHEERSKGICRKVFWGQHSLTFSQSSLFNELTDTLCRQAYKHPTTVVLYRRL